jgi:hypothetical protein
MTINDLYSFFNWAENPSTGQMATIIAWNLVKLILLAIFISDAPAEFIYAGF